MRSRVNNSKVTNNEDIFQEINKKNQQAREIQYEISQIQNEIGDMVDKIDTIEKEITSAHNSEGRSDLATLQTELENLRDEQKKLRDSSDKKLKELKIKQAKGSKELRELLNQGVFINGVRYKMVWNHNTMVALEQLYTSYNEWENLITQNSPSAMLNGARVMIAEFVRLHNADIDREIAEKALQSKDIKDEIDKLEATKLKVPSLEDIGLVPPAIIVVCVSTIAGYVPSVYSN